MDEFGLTQHCHCGHDITSHYVEAKGTTPSTCLARGCECRRYVNDRERLKIGVWSKKWQGF